MLPTRLKLLAPAALIALVLAAPASAGAAAPGKRGEHFEAVAVTRYLMGRVKPSVDARGVTHLWTNTGFSNRRAVYPVVDQQTLEDGSEWVKVQTVRGRGMVAAWIPRWATRRVWIDYRVLIDLSSRRATVYRKGRAVRRFRVVVGAGGTPTPRGRFFVMDRLRLRNSWARGGWALAVSAFSRVLTDFDGGQGQIAMHARGALTAPLGTASSNGCIRFADRQIAWMAANVPNGAPVWIQR